MSPHGCGGGPDPKCVDKEYLHGGGNGKSGAADYSLVRKVVPAAEIWLGEGGGQGCASGPDTQQLKSNELTDVYWWLDALGALQINAPASLKHPCSHPPFGPLVLKRGALPGSPPDQQNSLGVS